MIISGCTLTDKKNSAVAIGDGKYPLDQQGRVVLTEKEINQFQRQGQAIYIDNVLPSGAIVMTAEEMELLTSNTNVFNRFLDKVSPRQPRYQDAMISRGNIRLNIEKYAKLDHWLVNYVAKEYFIEKPFLVNAVDFQSLILEIVAEFPVFVTFNAVQKIVFIHQQNPQQIKQRHLLTVNNSHMTPTKVKEEIYSNGHFKQYKPSGRVSFELDQGLLKPQLVELLTNHQLIKSASNVKWLANSNYKWSSNYTAQAPSLDELIQQLLKPYGLRVDFKANGVVLVVNQEEVK